jgi:hypothetical protein
MQAWNFRPLVVVDDVPLPPLVALDDDVVPPLPPEVVVLGLLLPQAANTIAAAPSTPSVFTAFLMP